MKLDFDKYHGTGNDFILLDNRLSKFSESATSIRKLCNRHTGIGADGLITLKNGHDYEFRMSYYNSDGSEGSMCGNGGRCFVRYLNKLGFIKNEITFEAVDGTHHASLNNSGEVELQLNDVSHIRLIDNNYFLDTGSPHYVIFAENIDNIDVISRGSLLRYNRQLFPEGSNIDFVEIQKEHIYVRTYERGVENETLSCGTGVTASAIAAYLKSNKKKTSWKVKTKGGELVVKFSEENNIFKSIILTGPAVNVFNGEIVY